MSKKTENLVSNSTNNNVNTIKLKVIDGDKNTASYGLGDPCIPPEISNFPEEFPKSKAPLYKVDTADKKKNP